MPKPPSLRVGVVPLLSTTISTVNTAIHQNTNDDDAAQQEHHDPQKQKSLSVLVGRNWVNQLDFFAGKFDEGSDSSLMAGAVREAEEETRGCLEFIVRDVEKQNCADSSLDPCFDKIESSTFFGRKQTLFLASATPNLETLSISSAKDDGTTTTAILESFKKLYNNQHVSIAEDEALASSEFADFLLIPVFPELCSKEEFRNKYYSDNNNNNNKNNNISDFDLVPFTGARPIGHVFYENLVMIQEKLKMMDNIHRNNSNLKCIIGRAKPILSNPIRYCWRCDDDSHMNAPYPPMPKRHLQYSPPASTTSSSSSSFCTGPEILQGFISGFSCRKMDAPTATTKQMLQNVAEAAKNFDEQQQQQQQQQDSSLLFPLLLHLGDHAVIQRTDKNIIDSSSSTTTSTSSTHHQHYFVQISHLTRFFPIEYWNKIMILAEAAAATMSSSENGQQQKQQVMKVSSILAKHLPVLFFPFHSNDEKRRYCCALIRRLVKGDVDFAKLKSELFA